MKKKGIGYKTAARYCFVALSFLLFSSLDAYFTPFSLALLVADLYVGLNPIALLTFYILSFTVSFSVRTLLAETMGGVFFTAAFCLMKKNGKKPSASLAIFTVIALLPYIFMETCYDYALRTALAAAVVLLSYVMIPAAKVWLIKRLKYKLSTDEIVSAALAGDALPGGVHGIFADLQNVPQPGGDRCPKGNGVLRQGTQLSDDVPDDHQRP